MNKKRVPLMERHAKTLILRINRRRAGSVDDTTDAMRAVARTFADEGRIVVIRDGCGQSDCILSRVCSLCFPLIHKSQAALIT